MTRSRNFQHDECGAVSVDFVILTAAIVLLAIVSIPLINNATIGEAKKIEKHLSEIDPGAED